MVNSFSDSAPNTPIPCPGLLAFPFSYLQGQGGQNLLFPVPMPVTPGAVGTLPKWLIIGHPAACRRRGMEHVAQ